MKLTDEIEINAWAYNQCMIGNDTKQMRRLITNNALIYSYCRNIKDREEMLSKITDYDAYRYCKYIKDRPEVRRYIKDEINK